MECIDDSKPVAVAIELETFERREPGARRDQLVGQRLDRAAIARTRAQAVFARQRLTDQLEEGALQLFQIHGVTVRTRRGGACFENKSCCKRQVLALLA